MVFLHFLRWLRANTDLDFEILLLAGGPLAEDFAAIAPTHRVEALGRGATAYLEAGIAKAGFPDVSDRLKIGRARRSIGHLGHFDVLYLNSTTSALALRILPTVPPLVFSHIHELRSAFAYWFPERDRAKMLAATDWFVACADDVGRNLVDHYDVPADRVSVHHEFIDPPTVDGERARSMRESLGLPQGKPLVGGAGVTIWRKGPDLFIQAAAALNRARPDLDAHFVWVGGPGDEPLPIAQDIAKFGLDGRVHFVGEVVDPADLFSLFDVFCLTSREDPYPLVMLEAAATGAPIVSFPSGGVVEFAGEQHPERRRAVIVPYLDADAMATAVADLLDNDDERRHLANRGRGRVLTQHTIDVAASALYRELVVRMNRADEPTDLEHSAAPTVDLVGRSGSPVTAPVTTGARPTTGELAACPL